MRSYPAFKKTPQENISMGDDCLVPGTVHLVDLEGVVNSKHASGTQNDIVLVPAPSSDPNDPLNWSKKRKLFSTACVCV